MTHTSNSVVFSDLQQVRRPFDHLAVMDSGATNIFMDDKYRGDNHQETDNGIEVEVADQRKITSTSTDVVPFTNLLLLTTRTCTKFKDLSHSLVGVGVLCDAGNPVIFDRSGVAVKNEVTSDTIMQGIRHPHSRLYGPSPM